MHLLRNRSYIYHRKLSIKLDSITNRFLLSILRIELQDAHRYVFSLEKRLSSITRSIMNHLPFIFWKRFCFSQFLFLHRFQIREHNRFKLQFLWLLKNKKESELKLIKPVCYYGAQRNYPEVSHIEVLTRSQYSRSLLVDNRLVPICSAEALQSSSNYSFFKIQLNPLHFLSLTNFSLLKLHDKWLINLSSTEIPELIKEFLQLGANFCLPTQQGNREKLIVEFFKSIENGIRLLPVDEGQLVRNRCLPVIEKVAFSNLPTGHSDFILQQAYYQT